MIPIFIRHAMLIFTVAELFRLIFDHVSLSFEEIAWTRVWVVGDNGCLHRIDPITIREGYPLSSISWDPAQWSWPVVRSDDVPVSFVAH